MRRAPLSQGMWSLARLLQETRRMSLQAWFLRRIVWQMRRLTRLSTRQVNINSSFSFNFFIQFYNKLIIFRCNVSFECACDPGWKGLFCNEPICASECHPSQGYCEHPGECRCRLGWQGPMCKKCSTLPGCVHGTCQGPLECRCNPGWTGFLCSTRQS